ncbi:MAG TPA: methyltransferase domain-containing protein [Spirochaetia bacterium]|nr:methyltransferase domain-containing protein [Spirochaetia bacterium]
MTVSGEKYLISFDALDQQVNFEGYVRTASREDLTSIMDYLVDVHGKQNGSMSLNFRKLRYMNSSGVKVIADFLRYARQAKKLTIKLVGSKVIPWEEKSLAPLRGLWDGIEFQIYDERFYESQGIIEDAAFIPLLRNQTRLLWPREKPVLVEHGLREGMRAADICCGCGDVALLVARELGVGSIVGVDHSMPAIDYANRLQREFKVNNAEFRLGDATALLLDDEIFDFVLCRLSIQIFSRPDEILRELHRILRPGGRLYLTGEDYDLIVGYPNEAEIRSVYDKAGRYGQRMGMDLYNGRKLYASLAGMKMKNIKVDTIDADNLGTHRPTFAEMIASWRSFSAETIGQELGITESERAELLAGYDAHLATIRHPHGYTKWSVVAASGEKSK